MLYEVITRDQGGDQSDVAVVALPFSALIHRAAAGEARRGLPGGKILLEEGVVV